MLSLFLLLGVGLGDSLQFIMNTEKTIETEEFDVCILGTSLSQCALAAQLAESGLSVLVLDAAKDYGQWFAALTPDEFTHAVESFSAPGTFSSPHPAPAARARLCPLPALYHTAGGLVAAVQRRSLGDALPCSACKAVRVLDARGETLTSFDAPVSRAELLACRSLPLPQLRRLSRLATSLIPRSAAGETAASAQLGEGEAGSVEFDAHAVAQLTTGLPEGDFGEWAGDVAAVAAGAVAFTPRTPSGPAAPLAQRMRLTLCSIGYIAPQPFITPTYGAADAPQAFARRAAVAGATFALGATMVANGSAYDVSIPYSEGVALRFTASRFVVPEQAATTPASPYDCATDMHFGAALVAADKFPETQLAAAGCVQLTPFVHLSAQGGAACGLVLPRQASGAGWVGVQWWGAEGAVREVAELVGGEWSCLYTLRSMDISLHAALNMVDSNTHTFNCPTGYGPTDAAAEIEAADDVAAQLLSELGKGEGAEEEKEVEAAVVAASTHEVRARESELDVLLKSLEGF